MSDVRRRSFFRVVLLVIALNPTGTSVLALPSVQLPSPDKAVSRGGAIVAEIPIPAPPGAAGFEPALALRYSSQSGDGPFGVGWSLALSEIRRSTRFGMPTFNNATDEFELDGQRLIRGAAPRFHTMDESFQWIEPESYNTWSIWSTKGVVSRYGTTAGSVVTTPGGFKTRWLLSELEDPNGNRICFFYNQTQSPAQSGDNFPYLTKVTYTHRGACTQSAIGLGNKIEIDYEVRDDVSTLWLAGVQTTLRARATAIRVSVGTTLRRRLTLTYADDNDYTLRRARLASATLEGCEGVSACTALPGASFSWVDSGDTDHNGNLDNWSFWSPGSGLPTLQALPGPIEENKNGSGTESRDLGWRVGDVDGNGLPDLVRAWEPAVIFGLNPPILEVYLNNGSQFTFDQTWSDALEAVSFSTQCMRVVKNGSNVTDLPLVPRQAHMYFAQEQEWSDHAYQIGSDEVFCAPVNARLIDVDGDRRADLVASYRAVEATYTCGGTNCSASHQTGEVWLNTGNGWARDDDLSNTIPPFESFFLKEKEGGGINFPGDAKCVAGSSPCTAKIGWFAAGMHTADVNGDGGVDFMISRCTNCVPDNANLPETQAWLYDATGFYLAPAFTPPVLHVAGKAVFDYNQVDTGARYVDVNGDGLSDLVKTAVQDGVGELSGEGFDKKGVWLSNGTGWVCDGPCFSNQSRYFPDTPFLVYEAGTGVKSRQMLYADLNADGMVDIVRADGTHDAWLQERHGGNVWRPIGNRFDAPISVQAQVQKNYNEYHRSKGVLIGDFDGNGTLDFLSRYGTGAAVSFYAETQFSDRMEAMQNGEGGRLDLVYDSLVSQRDLQPGGIEVMGAFHAAAKGEHPGQTLGVVDYYWPTVPVVSEATLSGTDAPTYTWSFKYGFPLWDRILRIPFGNRGVKVTNPDGSVESRLVHQRHGLTGRPAYALLQDSEEGWVRESVNQWQVVPGTTALGSHSGAFVGRILEEQVRNFNAAVPGAEKVTTYTYSDALTGCNGKFNFACTISVQRPSGNSTLQRKPAHDEAFWVLGLAEWEKVFDGAGALRRHRSSVYFRGLLEERVQYATPALAGGLVQVLEQWVYDQYGNLTRQRNGRGFLTYFCYDGDAPLPGGGACPSQTGGHALLVGVEEPDVTPTVAPVGDPQSFVRDPMTGATTLYTSFNGDQTATSYDRLGRLASKRFTPAGGSEVTLETRVYGDGAVPFVESTLDTGAGTTVRSASYQDAYGRTIREVTPALPGAWKGVAKAYDHAGRVTTETYPQPCGLDAACSDLTTAATPRTEAQFDPLGRPTSLANADGTTIYQYASEERDHPPVAGPGTGEAYDVTIVTDGEGNMTRQLRDGERVVWSDECAEGSSGASCLSPDITFYTYEPTGETLAIYDAVAVRTAAWSADPHRTRFVYDTIGNQREIFDPDAGHRVNNFDANGNLATVKNARNLTIANTYDALDRLIAVDNPAVDEENPEPYEVDVTIAYDDDVGADGRWTRKRREVAQTGVYTSSLKYDAFGRLAQEKLTKGTGAPLFIDYQYDRLGRTTRIDYPSTSTSVGYVYDGARLTRVCRGNASGCMAASEDYVQSVTYDTLGRRDILDQRGGWIDYGYNGSHHLYTMHYHGASSTPLQLVHQYDHVGNLVHIVDTGPKPDGVDYTQDFLYDARNRLKQWRPSDDVWRDFAYDELGNLTQRPGTQGSVSQYFLNPTRPRAISSVGSSQATQYQYDADGNRSYDPQSSRYFTYDAAGRLVKIGTSSGGSQVATHVYDVDGRRIATTGGGHTRILLGSDFEYNVTTNTSIAFVFAFGELQATRTLPSTTLRTAGGSPGAWLPEVPPWSAGLLMLAGFATLAWLAVRLGVPEQIVHRPVAGTTSLLVIVAITAIPARAGVPPGPSAVVRWYANDLVGTALMVTDASGTPVARRMSEPFGGVWSQWTNGETTRKRYAGHMEDPASSLFDFSARWYDSATGSFLSTDPLIANPADPQQHNPYAYARGNPYRYVDPTGEFLVEFLTGLVSLFSGFDFGNWNFSFSFGNFDFGGITGLTLGFTPGRDLNLDFSVAGVKVARFSTPLQTTEVHTAPAQPSVSPAAQQPQAQGDADGEPNWVNPTGQATRGCDSYGCGDFGASRDGGTRSHAGTDFLSTPAQDVVAPAGGTLVRAVERVYRDDPAYQGAVIRTPSGYEMKLLYVNPDRSLIGQIVGAGSRIGTAQDLSVRYPGGPGPAIPNHVHIEVRNPLGVPIDPRTMIPAP